MTIGDSEVNIEGGLVEDDYSCASFPTITVYPFSVEPQQYDLIVNDGADNVLIGDATFGVDRE